jgi:signal transduction histidine kinase
MPPTDVKRTSRIAVRFAILLAAAAVVPLLAYGAWSMVSLRDGAREAVIQGNLNVARRAAEQIESYVANNIRILKAVAANLRETELERWQQDRILKNHALDFPEFTELTVLGANGAGVATSRTGAATVAVPGSDSRTIDGVLLAPFSIDDDLLPTTVLAVSLGGSDDDGWLVARLNLEELWRTVDAIRVGQEGFASVVTADGTLLAHGDPDAKPRVARRDSMKTHPLIVAAQAVAGARQPVSEIYGDGGRQMVGVAVPAAALDWTIIVEQPATEAFAIPSRLQRQLAIAIAIALLAMLAAGYYWGKSFIDPIMSLTRGTAALAAGRLDERVVVETDDELGQLGVAFNNMADRLVELQEDVRKKERQAMFGRISIGLVHDLSHPIQNIGNSCKLIVKMFDDLEYRESFRRTVERELAQVKRVLDDLRNVARPLPLERFPLDINKTVADLVESMRQAAAAAGLTLDSEVAPGPLFIEGDLFALNRVYQNLITNAVQATPAPGRIVVRTRPADDQAVVEVSDTGAGIPPDRLDTIFDDFMTTKRQGLGLGLAISKKVVEQLGGTITAASRVGEGSTFTTRFPLTRARPSPLNAN